MPLHILHKCRTRFSRIGISVIVSASQLVHDSAKVFGADRIQGLFRVAKEYEPQAKITAGFGFGMSSGRSLSRSAEYWVMEKYLFQGFGRMDAQ